MNSTSNSSQLLRWLVLILFSIGIGNFGLAQTEEVRQQEDKELSEFFEKAHSALDEALEIFDDRAKKTWRFMIF